MTTLQRLVFANLDVRVAEDMVLRLNDRAWADLRGGAVHFSDGGILSSDTFYNGFTVSTWKRRCAIGQLRLALAGAGEFLLTLGLHRLEQASVWLAEHRISLTPDAPLDLDLSDWPQLVDGMLFYRLRALGPATIAGGAFHTPDAPRHDVGLGLVITHFNRQAQVLPAIDRIRRELLDDLVLGGRLSLTVVDNSVNLALAPHPRIRHIPNRNLGGTGGFVRGLLSLIDDPGDDGCARRTHALFMDDDASCETESIARTLALLLHAAEPTLAVAGALLREVAPWELLEKGACFDGRVRALHGGLDMRVVTHLLAAERMPERPDYGAWWFFAFPLAEVRQFPFPFFVRGDDIFFGLANRFDIVTMNGIACLGEDFSSKHGPLTAYLDARYHLVHALLFGDDSASRVFWVGTRLFVKALSGYLYTSARAVTLALRHVLEGPRFFSRNLDLQAVRAEIASWTPAEKLLPVDRSTLELRPARRPQESFGRRLARAVTLQGFLLPDALIRDRTTVQAKSFHGRASGVFRYRRIFYEHAATSTGFVAEFDRRRFFAELKSFLTAWSTFFRRLPALRAEYAAGVHQLTSIAYWREVYPETRAAAPAAPSRADADVLDPPRHELPTSDPQDDDSALPGSAGAARTPATGQRVGPGDRAAVVEAPIGSSSADAAPLPSAVAPSRAR